MKLRIALLLTAAISLAHADTPTKPPPAFDAELAHRLGADENGMHLYVLVILKSGPTRVPAGKVRDAMFTQHFANIQRLANEGKLVLAGPFDDTGGWRGMFILDAKSIDEAKALTATDPVVSSGEMIGEYHVFYGSAALKLVNEIHSKIQSKGF